jgi:hypothetical protein
VQQHLTWWVDLLDILDHIAVPREHIALSQQVRVYHLKSDQEAHAASQHSTYAMPEIISHSFSIDND